MSMYLNIITSAMLILTAQQGHKEWNSAGHYIPLRNSLVYELLVLEEDHWSYCSNSFSVSALDMETGNVPPLNTATTPQESINE